MTYMPTPHEFSDDESGSLLAQLYCFVEYYDITVDSISELAAELAQSQNRTSDAEDEMRRAIEARFDLAN